MVCGNCSPEEWLLEHISTKLQRVCNPCYKTLKSTNRPVYAKGGKAAASKPGATTARRAHKQVSAADKRAIFVPPSTTEDSGSPPPPPVPAKPKNLFSVGKKAPKVRAETHDPGETGRRNSRRISAEGLRLFQGAMATSSGPPPVPPKPKPAPAKTRRPPPRRPAPRRRPPPKIPPKPHSSGGGNVRALATKFSK